MRKLSIPSSFESMTSVLVVTNNECCVPIKASVGKSNTIRGGANSPLGICCGIAKHKLTAKLKHICDCEPLFLTDEEMGQWDDLNNPKLDDQIKKQLYQFVEARELRYFNNT